MPKRKSRVTRGLNPGVYERPDGKLQAQIKIPDDVRYAYKSAKLVRSLGTSDPDEANRLHALLVSRMEAEFDSLRRGASSRSFERFARKLHEYQTKEIGRISDRALESYSEESLANVYTTASAGQRLNTTDPSELVATAGWAADWYYSELLGVEILEVPDSVRSTKGYLQVTRECAEVLKDSWRAGRQAELGRPVTPPRYPALTSGPDESQDGNKAMDDRGALPVSRYFNEVYLPARTRELAANTVKVKRQALDLFGELVGDPPLYLLSRAQVADFQRDLKWLPDQRFLTGSNATMPKRELVQLQQAGKAQLKRLGAGTIVKHVQNLKELLGFAHSEGHIRLNPALGMRNVKASAENPSVEKRPFTLGELQAIFSQPLYAGCKSDTVNGVFKPGDVRIRDERFWVTFLLFLTGARASEIAGLERSEVTIADGMCRVVFKNTPLRRLKNSESERVIPLHPWALATGFDRYLNTLSAGSSAVFPNLVRAVAAAGGFGEDDEKLDGISLFRQFNRTILGHVGLRDDPTVSLHSFRHVFEDAMTGRDIPSEVMFRLTGRTIGSTRAIYTKSLPADENRRAQLAADYMRHVERIDFGGLDLTHLR